MQWEICEKILYNPKRRQKLRNARSNNEKREMIHRYIVADCAKLKLKMPSEEMDYITAEILERLSLMAV